MRNRNSVDENFYIILGVDYKKPETDVNVIKEKIENRKTYLSSKLTNPVKAGKAGAYLRLIQSAELKKVMLPAASDAEGIKLQREEAEVALNAAENKIIDEINNVASKTKRSVKKSVLNNIIDSEDGLKQYQITYSMVEKICADNSITIDDEPSKKANSKYSIIKRKLKELGFGSFYDYLESYISENKNSSYKQYNSSEQLSKLSAKELYDITMEAYGYYSKLPAGTKDNQTTLSANHKTLFGDENLKNIYDISLQPDKDNLPEGVVGTIKRYANTQIDHDKAMELIQQCKNFNPSWSQDEIIEMLGDEALKKKVKIELPQMQQKPLFIRCLLCNNYIPSEKKTCPKCRGTVWVACPKCKKQIQNGEKVCPECGFDIEREKKAREACDNARKAILKYRFEDAQNYIDNARAVYPGYADITNLQNELRNQKNIIDSKLDSLKRLIKEKKFVQAKSEYESLLRLTGAISDPLILNAIIQGINRADTFYKKAIQTGCCENEIVDNCTKALEECTDYENARNMLLKYPPKPVTNLSITNSNDGIVVKWSGTASGGNIVYKLVRKYDSVPRNITEGELLSETSGCYYMDKNVEAGRPVYYSVFVYRAGISGAVTSTTRPIYRYAEVSNINVVEGDSLVILNWTQPRSCYRVDIVKKMDSVPRDIRDGQRISNALNQHYQDNSVINGKKYYYKFFTVYNDEYGEHISNGTTVCAIPERPLQPVKNVKVKPYGNGYIVEWEKEKQGNVELFYSDKQLPLGMGTIKSSGDIARMMHSLNVSSMSQNNALFSLDVERTVYIYPLIKNETSYIIGAFDKITIIKDVKLLKNPTLSGNSIIIQIDPSSLKDADSIVVKYRNDTYTSSTDSNDPGIEMPVKGYLASQGIVINNVIKSNYYFTIYAKKDGDYSNGINAFVTNQAKGTLYYSTKITKKSLFHKQASVKVTIASDFENIPNLILLQKVNFQPLSKSDGVILQRIGASQKNRIVIDIQNNSITENSRFALFLEDDNLYKTVQIQRRDDI